MGIPSVSPSLSLEVMSDASLVWGARAGARQPWRHAGHVVLNCWDRGQAAIPQVQAHTAHKLTAGCPFQVSSRNPGENPAEAEAPHISSSAGAEGLCKCPPALRTGGYLLGFCHSLGSEHGASPPALPQLNVADAGLCMVSIERSPSTARRRRERSSCCWRPSAVSWKQKCGANTLATGRSPGTGR